MLHNIGHSNVPTYISTPHFFLKSLHVQKNVIFFSEFVILGENPPFYEVNQ